MKNQNFTENFKLSHFLNEIKKSAAQKLQNYKITKLQNYKITKLI